MNHIVVQPKQIQQFSTYEIQLDGKTFPGLQIDRGSYIVDLEIQSGLNFCVEQGRHCLQLGKYNALADSITCMIDLNHPYHQVAQGSLDFQEQASYTGGGVPWATNS